MIISVFVILGYDGNQMMEKYLVTLVCVLFATLTASICGHNLPGPPERPQVFTSPEALRDYLRQLNEYFAVVGRPRFGRSIQKRHPFITKVGIPSSESTLYE
ncbi:pro-neuropeptide Y-like isoform X4 [Tubulanus polymorphus]|uniref:pro-neuropeptide Y-like isoform X4 n=1 Tax=Tubulanus polymorphus TaxID=672921 RepID=UPI003DA57037